jgi:hypothetical protein
MAAATTQENQHDNDRVLVHVPLPSGMLGVRFSDPVPQYASDNHVWVLSVNADSPLAGNSDNDNDNRGTSVSTSSASSSILETGDWIVSINDCNVHGQEASFCLGILAATIQSATRKMVVLRSRTKQRFIYQEENNDVNDTDVNTATTKATTKATKNNKVAAMAAVDAPTKTTTTTTKKPTAAPLLSDAVIAAFGKILSDEQKAKKKKEQQQQQQQQQPNKLLNPAQRKQAPLPRVVRPEVSESPIRIRGPGPTLPRELPTPVLGDTDTRQDTSRHTHNMMYHRGTIQLQGLKDMYAAAKESWEAQTVQLETTIAQLEARMDTATVARNHNHDHDADYSEAVGVGQHQQHGVLNRQLHRHLPAPSAGLNTDTMDCHPQYQGKKCGVPLPIQQLLLHHIEGPKTRHMKCHTICNLRPDLYGAPGSKRRRAVQNKLQWFKKLKSDDPAVYWKLVPDHATFDEHNVKGTTAALHDEKRALDMKSPAAAKKKSVTKRKSGDLDDSDDELEDAILLEQQTEKKAARSAEMQKRLDSDSSLDNEDPDYNSKPAAKRKSDELEDSDDELEEPLSAK